MNLARILLGGALAGIVLNALEAVLHGQLLAEPTATAIRALGHDPAGSGLGIGMLVAITFLQAVVGMTLYAAVLARWKSGTRTAIRVGLIVWLFSALYASVYLYAGFPGVFPADVVWIPAAWGLVEFPLAIAIGAKVYREPA